MIFRLNLSQLNFPQIQQSMDSFRHTDFFLPLPSFPGSCCKTWSTDGRSKPRQRRPRDPGSKLRVRLTLSMQYHQPGVRDKALE